MNRIIRIAFLMLFLPLSMYAQLSGSLQGKVLEVTQEGETLPLIGANVYWLGTLVGTATDVNGQFKIQRVPETTRLVISFIGYMNDTLDMKGKNRVEVQLIESVMLKEVEIVHRRKSSELSLMEPLNTIKIGEGELLKAACCNLSESFETNPSVDVSFTDAVTGTRQIQMLGLAGAYTQITRENMPDIRGMSSIYGLTFIPGTWIQSIQLNKGAGSVANGYESIAGQINVELRRPEIADRLYLNLYGNQGSRFEVNANFAHRFKDSNWSTALLLHGKKNSHKIDKNEDGFLDMPLSEQFIALNRWKFADGKGLNFQFGVKGTFIDNTGGQTEFDPRTDALTGNSWGMHMNIQRLEAWAKLGKVYIDMPWKTFGFQFSGVNHQQDSYFGLNDYDTKQNSFYANFIYQSILSNTNHKFKTGASLQYDDYIESLNGQVFDRKEVVPGAYFEYTYTNTEVFSLVLGLRGDYHNIFGFFATPRMHMRYAIGDNSVLRASLGRGQRTANIIAENVGVLASSRMLVIPNTDNEKPYGLDQESAWNYGLNFLQKFKWGARDGSISFDFYRTAFENQIIVDLDQDPQQVFFYNLEGKSYSNSFQTQFDYELFSRFDVRLAYRWYDVKTTYSNELLKKPLVASHRAFVNLAYHTPNGWGFDVTANWQGQKRIPSTASNPVEYQRDELSPDFVMMNVQMSKKWTDKFEIYVGAENLLNYKQNNPIIASDAPFSEYFDSSLVWGPVFGRNVYFGLRYKLK